MNFFSGKERADNKIEKKSFYQSYPFFLRTYQYLISPFFPPSCRFYPSCSEYAVESIQKFGLWIGLVKSMRRVLRCHPWHSGGYDPVIKK
ncbi:MAG: membrane protein insertion efficiency factor YidD [bacterium]|nr:membrane protein insertion efficiency factor YidD [bacterium]